MHAVMGSGRLIAGRYRLQGPIGRGAMGIVWRGRDELLARDVAVKEVQITAQAAPADAEGIYQRTLREARTAARLSHPGVVTVFDVVEENGSPWIVMEFVTARSLDRVITEDGPLPPLRAAELGTSLVGALGAAHAAGVLHRDVKPSNVLITDDGKVVLTDFGIAMFTGDPGHTQVGMVMGTPGFTAPERVRGDAATPASDLWSLGATLYAAVEGRGPFERVGGGTAITAGVAAEDAPRAPSAGPLGPVIDALLSRDPDVRPDAATAARLLTTAITAAMASLDEQGTASLDPRVFADLPVPELPVPELSDPELPGQLPGPAGSFASGSGGSGYGESVSAGSGSAGSGHDWSGSGGSDADGSDAGGSDAGGFGPAGTDASMRFPWRGGPARPTPGRSRLILAALGIAAVTVAAIVGWDSYTRSPTTQALASPQRPGITAPGGSAGSANHASSGPGAAGSRSGNTPGAGGSAPATGSQPPGKGSPSSGASGKPGPSSSPSTSASPSPSPSSTGPVLPTGYVWHRFTAAAMGSTAGFEMALPSSWLSSTAGLSAHLNQAARNFHLTIDLAPWTRVGPLAQAQSIASNAAKTDTGYKLLSLAEIGFKSVGGFTAAPAAELKFRWTKTTGGSYTELVILVTLLTKAGAQPYHFALSAPSATFSSAASVFHTAMTTFRPLPS